MPAKWRETLAGAAQEGRHVLLLETSNVAEVAVADAGQGTGGRRLGQKALHLLGQVSGAAGGHRPGDSGLDRQGQGHAQVGKEVGRQGVLHPVRGGQIEVALGDHLQQVGIAPALGMQNLQAGDAMLDGLKGLRRWGTSPNPDNATGKVAFIRDCPAVVPGHDHVIHLPQGRAPAQGQALVGGKPGRRQMRLPLHHGVKNLKRIRIDFKSHWHAQPHTQRHQQVVLVSARATADLVDPVGQGVQPGSHPQLTGRPITVLPYRRGRICRAAEQEGDQHSRQAIAHRVSESQGRGILPVTRAIHNRCPALAALKSRCFASMVCV